MELNALRLQSVTEERTFTRPRGLRLGPNVPSPGILCPCHRRPGWFPYFASPQIEYTRRRKWAAAARRLSGSIDNISNVAAEAKKKLYICICKARWENPQTNHEQRKWTTAQWKLATANNWPRGNPKARKGIENQESNSKFIRHPWQISFDCPRWGSR